MDSSDVSLDRTKTPRARPVRILPLAWMLHQRGARKSGANAMTLAEMLNQKVTPLSDWILPRYKSINQNAPRPKKINSAMKLLPHLKEPISAHDLAEIASTPYNTVYSQLISLLEKNRVVEIKTKTRTRLWVAKG